jgi:hypothetical protein
MTELEVDAGIPAEVFTPQAPDAEQFEFFEPWPLSLAELPGAVAGSRSLALPSAASS